MLMFTHYNECLKFGDTHICTQAIPGNLYKSTKLKDSLQTLIYLYVIAGLSLVYVQEVGNSLSSLGCPVHLAVSAFTWECQHSSTFGHSLCDITK